MKFQRRTEIIEAIQWFKLGDHEDVSPSCNLGHCSTCHKPLSWHGWFWKQRIYEGRLVCPCDWLVTDSRRTLVVSDAEFRKMYEPLAASFEPPEKYWEELEKYWDWVKAQRVTIDNPLIGQCARCGGNLTADHKCPEWVK